MNNSEWAESYFPIYTADSIQSLYSTSTMPIHKIHENLTVLLAVSSGQGTLHLDDHIYELADGMVILIPAKSDVVIQGNQMHPLHIYTLSISTQEQKRSRPVEAMVRSSVLAAGTYIEFYEPTIAAQLEQIYMHRLPGNEVRHMRNQILFHQVLMSLLERMEARYIASEQPSMERSIAFMENHFSEKITTEGLSEIAGVSRSHYSILFKQLTGFSPNEYLSRLRVHRAKELLIGGSASLREIALKVGYKDEFYFSRRFKQQTGESPSSFTRRRPFQRVAVWFAPYASHLMLLGLEPAVVISESSEYVSTEGVSPPQTIRFIHSDSSSEQIKSALLDAHIELIIAANQHLDMNGLSSERLRSIAPIVEIAWMELGWKEHLRFIAQATQRVEQAEQWLADFEREEQQAREAIQTSQIVNETLTILVIKPDTLQIYGVRNVGYVMYQSLGLRPPAKIAQEIQRFGDQFHSVSIQLSELQDYEGTRMLVLVFPDEKGSKAHSEMIFNSEYWKGLEAVKRNRIYDLEQEEWIPYNPVSIRLQLGRAVSLWTGIQ
ncbi:MULTISPECIES: helix-turn-helix domain-containing protein [Paenibacillus]|uniref:Substrate-binding family protein n=1 Tax=Paenibacillus pabuli TaxID=1472 RepID=A0A855XXR5_9BACL|nr:MULTISPECIES: helix-turn-helix domain-containing protein [Paenibacillus]PWW41101.1 substrate-binding family protein [Paenibacillus pabuli]PXW12225.1 substrate-binding family protein [Paenibacillus taichungensis]